MAQFPPIIKLIFQLTPLVHYLFIELLKCNIVKLWCAECNGHSIPHFIANTCVDIGQGIKALDVWKNPVYA